MKFLFIIFIFHFSVCLSQEKKVYIFREDIRLSEDEFNYLINEPWVMSRTEFSVQDSLFSNDTIFYNMNIIEKEGITYDKKVKILNREYYPSHEVDFANAFDLSSTGNNLTNNFYLNEENVLAQYTVYDYYKDYKDQLNFELQEDYTVYTNGEIVIVFRSISGHHVLIKQVDQELLRKIKLLPSNIFADNYEGRMVYNYFIRFKQIKQSLTSRLEFEKDYSVFREIRETKWGGAFSIFTKIEKSDRYNKIKELVITSHLDGELPIYKRGLPMMEGPPTMRK